MLKAIYAALFCMLIFSACQNKKSIPPDARTQARIIDSLTRARASALRKQEEEVLADRLSIELKERTDSILAARTKPRDSQQIQKMPAMPASAEGEKNAANAASTQAAASADTNRKAEPIPAKSYKPTLPFHHKKP